MQTFVPLADFEMSARTLDRQRLGCQRKEAFQILQILLTGPRIKKCLECMKSHAVHANCSTPGCKMTVRLESNTPWYNHPAVRMWKGYEACLSLYGMNICSEWSRRGYNDNLYGKFEAEFQKQLLDVSDFSTNCYPPWFGDDRVHSSHRAALLFKNFSHYYQFCWIEKPSIPIPGKSLYFWPA